MKRLFALLLFLSYGAVSADIDPSRCIKNDNDAIAVMTVTMFEDLKLKHTAVDLQKTEAEIIAVVPVNHALALMYGEEEHQLDGPNSDIVTTAEEYAQGFMQDNTKNIIVKYTFRNKQGRQNIFLASTFVSDVSCVARFNGYIIVQREF